jgi:hypothetical protein
MTAILKTTDRIGYETHEQWCERIEAKLSNGTPRQQENARWQMGFKTGVRKEQTRLLQILEYYQVIWWDEAQTVWLNMSTGKPLHGLDWREEGKHE